MRRQLTKSYCFPILLGIFFLCGSCTSKSEKEYEQSPKSQIQNMDAKDNMAASRSIPAGPLMDEKIGFEFAIYYLPEPLNNPSDELDALLKDRFSAFQNVEKISKDMEGMVVAARLVSDVKKSYAPPPLDALQRFGHGLSREQAVAVQSSKTVFLLDFTYSKDHVWDGMRAALELTKAIAEATNGLIWDDETRELFSIEEWNKVRIQDWTEDVPDITKHITMHAYKKEEFVRAITLGMAKFGLPDVVMEDFSWSISRNIGHIINLFAQAMAEGAVLHEPGQYDLDLRSIKNAKVREPQIKSLKSHATSIGLLSLKEGVWENGDPKNRLVLITSDRYDGPDVQAKQERMLGDVFGWEDKIAHVKHDEALQTASQKARAELGALRTAFNAGLAPGEFIHVKVPFETPDGGKEWMWVEVTSWTGDKIKGLLRNEPFNIPALHAGQIVEVSEATVFDYIRKHPDGSTEGNETGKLIDK